MTISEIFKKLGLVVPQDPISRDSYLFELLEKRTAESDAELRQKQSKSSPEKPRVRVGKIKVI